MCHFQGTYIITNSNREFPHLRGRFFFFMELMSVLVSKFKRLSAKGGQVLSKFP